MAAKQESIQDAEKHNSRGSDAYKAGNFLTAASSYCKAAKLNKAEPKYLSNATAAFFEAGDYIESLTFIALAWEAILTKENLDEEITINSEINPLFIRLATRYAKAKLNAIQAGKLSFHHEQLLEKSPSHKIYESRRKIFTNIENACSKSDWSPLTDIKMKDLHSAWTQMKIVKLACDEHSAQDCEQERANAMKRFRSLQIFKSPLDPAMEYFKFGHDDVQSLMNGLNNETNDAFCLDTRITRLKRDRKNYSFLFGGSGDGRHVFATLIHFADFAKAKNSDKLVKGMSGHFTLVDIHPATLTRNLVIFSVLQQITQAREKRDEQLTIELIATAFYVHAAVIMPEVCYKIVQDTATQLLDDLPTGKHQMSKIFHIDHASMQQVLKILRYWSKPLPKTVKGFLERLSQSPGNCKRSFTMHGPAQREKQKQGQGPDPALMEKFLEQMTGGRPMGDWGEDPDAQKNLQAQNLIDPYADSYGEADIWDHARVLLPPKTFLSSFPSLQKIVKSYKKSLPASSWRPLVREVEDKWKVNPTLFDEESTENSWFGGGVGYPIMSGTPYDNLFSFSPFNKLFEPSLLRKSSPIIAEITSFDIMGRFFELASEALYLLRNALKIEIVVGDVMMGTAKLVHGDSGERPKGFPDKWTRMFLSNVPDYTNGALGTSVHLSPYVENQGVIIANCLLNTGLFASVNHQVASYALIPARQFPRMLGTNVLLQEREAFSDIAIQTNELPLPVESLGSKVELHHWLSRLLLCTLSNSTPAAPPIRVFLPSNIHDFFHLLMHLHRVGFPAHWIGEFVQAIIDDKLVTDAVAYTGQTPIPLSALSNKVSTARRVNLACWNAEISTIVASIRSALPFGLTLPKNFPIFKDVKLLKAKKVGFHGYDPFLHALSSPFVKSAALLFYKDEKSVKRDTIVKKILSVIEGDLPTKDVEIQILLGPEAMNINSREITWKITEQWYLKMKREGWKMVVYRTDLLICATNPVNAADWQDIS